MNTLHVTSLPPDMTTQQLRDLFGQIGPVLRAKIIRNGDGQCLTGLVDMVYASDAEEILLTQDRLSIGGRHPHIGRKAGEDSTIGHCIKSEYAGVHLEQCRGQWYGFELRDGHLYWCRSLTPDIAANFYRQYLEGSTR
jgi:RNA recognition motif-containing protein